VAAARNEQDGGDVPGQQQKDQKELERAQLLDPRQDHAQHCPEKHVDAVQVGLVFTIRQFPEAEDGRNLSYSLQHT
jgi:hypothetical protein